MRFCFNQVRIYPPESKTRKILFIVPDKYPDKLATEKTLSALTGGRVEVEEVRPYTGFEPGAAYVSREEDGEKLVPNFLSYLTVKLLSYFYKALIFLEKVFSVSAFKRAHAII